MEGDIITDPKHETRHTNQKPNIPPDQEQVTLDVMDIEKGDYQTEEENTNYIHPIDRKTRQSSIPLGEKRRDDR
jgi:hypothetical protein